MEKTIFLMLAVLQLMVSCRKEIKSIKGGIDIVSVVYFKALKNLNRSQTFHLSAINYSDDLIIERIPEADLAAVTREMYLIKDSLSYKIGTDNPGSIVISDLVKSQKPIPVKLKKTGALFSDEQIPNYRNRKDLSDTVLFKKRYRRFEINSPWMYTRFYIYPTDTILPYSVYKHAEKDYHGRLERIDSYNKKSDIFATLQLIPRRYWDNEAAEVFKFNSFLNKIKSE